MPFLGYAAVAALALQLALQAAPKTALLALLLGSAVLLSGDKLVRPMVARGGMRLPFVWVLMGCIGGFGALGLAGLVIGPVMLSLVREMWSSGRALMRADAKALHRFHAGFDAWSSKRARVTGSVSAVSGSWSKHGKRVAFLRRASWCAHSSTRQATPATALAACAPLR